jgi:molybdopterin-binding protein
VHPDANFISPLRQIQGTNSTSLNLTCARVPTIELPQTLSSCYVPIMTLSARNKLSGKIEELQLGGVMAHVVIRVGNDLIESVITRRSAEEMKLKIGDTVKAVIKSTEVMLEKD